MATADQVNLIRASLNTKFPGRRFVVACWSNLRDQPIDIQYDTNITEGAELDKIKDTVENLKGITRAVRWTWIPF